MPYNIKSATVGDTPLLSEMSTTTFYDTYAAYNTHEDMELYINTYFTEAVIQQELQQEDITYFIAYINDAPAGYVKVNTSNTKDNLPDGQQVEIERLYVYKQYQGQQIGYELIAYLKKWAAQNNRHILWLGVWEHNTRARTFYERVGFEVFGSHLFKLGNDLQNDLLMYMTVM